MAYPNPDPPPSTSSRSSLNIMGVNEGLLTPRSVHSEEAEQLLNASGDVERGRVDHAAYGSTSSSEEEGNKSRRRSKMKRRVKYYIPGIAWIPKYSLSSLGGDVLAGFTVASMLIPQSVSYASSLARLNPVTGLFSASIPGIVYAFLGTSRQLNVAPEAALSLLLGQAVSDIHHDMDDHHNGFPDKLGLSVATVITLQLSPDLTVGSQVGLISFLLGFFRLGFIDVVLSRALLRGFVAAVAVVIMIEQLIPMFGLVALEHQIQPDTTFEKLLFLIENIWEHAHWNTTIISFASLAILVVSRSFKQFFKKYWFIYRIPEVLVVVVLSTWLSNEFRWDQAGVDILGHVPVTTGEGSFFQSPLKHSNLRFLKRTTSTAVVISVIGFLDSIVAAKGAAAKFGYTVSPNRELVALGAANLVASFVPGTLPAYGSITRTRINGDVGARTQMTSLVCSGVILLATFFLLPWLHYLPKCVLASIILLVVFSLIAETPHDVYYYWKMRSWVDITLMTLTFVFSIIWNVEVGIVVSLIISLLLVVHRSSKTRMTILGRIPGTDRWKPINENPEAEEDVEGAVIVRLKENLDFANTAQLKERLRRLELYGVRKSHPSDRPSRKEATTIVFHMADVDSCDAIAAQIILELAEEYRNRGVGIVFTHVQPGLRSTFEKAGIVKFLGIDAFKDNVADAMAARAR
ncbi:hypothetical protein VNI00_011701 [Paramarasmius palmivorus]|uniref:STAS domain-containing protein n=1 Tax=Paramarasmius palmivorus TaxID=297713 RepID=A0AAW0CEQ7_9AGAR